MHNSQQIHEIDPSMIEFANSIWVKLANEYENKRTRRENTYSNQDIDETDLNV